MIKRRMALCAVLAFAAVAVADIEIDLRPATPGPYTPGGVVNVEAWFVDMDSGHPITGEDILFRGYQLDFTLTDDTLKLPDQMNMESLPAGGEMLVGNLDVTVDDDGMLDVMKPEEDEGLGAWVKFGFGQDGDDPVITWRAFTGELTGGQLSMSVAGTLSIVSSVPPDSAIDARQPSDVDGTDSSGWSEISITFDGDASDVSVSDFTVTVNPADVTPPSITFVGHPSSNTVTLYLDGIIPTGHWTVLTYNPTGGNTRIGYLPADVNGDGISSTVDILDLLDFLNGYISLPEWGTDINRSGLSTPRDMITEINLLNGCGSWNSWNGMTLP